MKPVIFLFVLFFTVFFSCTVVAQNWQIQNSNFPSNVLVVDFSSVNEQVCWAVGQIFPGETTPYAGYIRTTDGGNTWVCDTIPGLTDTYSQQVFAIDADTAYVSVYVLSSQSSKGIYKTKNGGTTWVRQNAFNTSLLGPGIMHFFDSQNGVVIGDPNLETYTTSNGGLTWNPVTMPSALTDETTLLGESRITAVGNTVWFPTNRRLFKSTDKGYTWTVLVNDPQYYDWLQSIAFQDNLTGIYGLKISGNGTNHIYKKTTDGGTTWDTLSNSILDNLAPSCIQHIPGTSSTYIAAAGRTPTMRGVAVTYDAGESWTLIDTLGVFFINFVNTTVGWGSQYGTNVVYKYIGPPLSNQDTIYVPGDYQTIQEAINAAVGGNLVLVDDGTYVENINFKGKAITLASRFFIDGDESHIENTIIDGSQPSHPDSGSVVTFNSDEDTTSILCGFTITGGTGNIIGLLNARMGGGICVFYSGTTIKNNIIELNTMAYNNNAYGGGIGANSHNVDHYIIENNLIQNNSINTPVVTDYSLGGGIYTMTDGSVRIINNRIINNTITAPTAYGGGIEPTYFNDADYSILNNFISSNSINATDGFGGGIDVYSFSPLIKNNLIVNNSAPTGGGIFIEDGIPNLTSNTIANNAATVSGGGFEIVGVAPEIINCIIWGNTAPTGSQINGTAEVSYSDVEGGYTGTGNLNIDPLFRDAASGDFHLQSTDCGHSFNSPCIDAGNPAYEDWPLSCDWGLGQVRSDMGAYGGANSVVDVPEEDIELPSDYVLYQNYPNPFNPSTTFRYSIPQTSKVVIKVYDILGNEIATLMDEEKSVGTYEATWYAEQLPSGVYFYQLKAGSFIETKKMLLLK
jgi:photosystem II stability/assembly factor-like uncharacterized protein